MPGKVSKGVPDINQAVGALVFEEPLVAIGRPDSAQVEALAVILKAYIQGGRLDDLRGLREYMRTHSGNPWELSLLVNLGLMHRHNGEVAQAIEMWEAAWTLGKSMKHPKARPFALRALGELAEVYAGIGRHERLEALLKESQGIRLTGLVTEKLAAAKESLIIMRTSPERAYRCGPLALTQIKAMEDAKAFSDPAFEGMDATLTGTTLAMNAQRAEKRGMNLQMAKRAPGSKMPVPAVVHWKTDHFSALVREAGGKYLVQDPALGDTWVSGKVLDEESTGYALIAAGPLPEGWKAVGEQEGLGVWGRGAWGPGRPDDTRRDSHRIPETGTTAFRPGAPQHRFHTSLASLNLETNLIQYQPAKGPKVEFTATYNQREYGQPQLFDYCNLGPKWTFTYLACLKDDTTNPYFNVSVCYSGGGGLVFRAKGDGSYEPEDHTQAVLTRTSPASYTIAYLDGRIEHYTLADRAFGLRRIVLTKITDAKGDAVNLSWDMRLRLVGIEDAEGKRTTLSYELGADPLKLTRITDPSGKSASFEYNAAGHLITLRSPSGQVSRFTYGPTQDMPWAPGDFLNSVSTQEGTMRFRMGEEMRSLNVVRWLEAQGKDGRVERLESASEFGSALSKDVIPAIPELDPGVLDFRFGFRNSFYWPAGLSAQDRKSYGKAVNYQWGHGPGGFASGILITEKKPGENRTFFVHAGPFWGGVHPMARKHSELPTPVLQPRFEGGRRLVTCEAQVLPDGSTRAIRHAYDESGRPVAMAEVEGASTRPTASTPAPAAKP